MTQGLFRHERIPVRRCARGFRGGTISVLPAIMYDDVESNDLTCGENEDAFGPDPDYEDWTTPNRVSGIGELQIMPIEAPPLEQPEIDTGNEEGDYFILGDQGQVAGTVNVCCDVASRALQGHGLRI